MLLVSTEAGSSVTNLPPERQQRINTTVDYSREHLIAAQALEALRLRREWERGALTQDYLDALTALQGTEASQISQGKSERAQLRRSLDRGKATTQENPAQLHGQSEPECPTSATLSPQRTPGAVPQRPAGPLIRYGTA
jgi:hypothetical protein